MTDIRNKTIEGLKIGDLFSISRTFTEQDMLSLADITGDYNPVHFDDRFSRAETSEDGSVTDCYWGASVQKLEGKLGY